MTMAPDGFRPRGPRAACIHAVAACVFARSGDFGDCVASSSLDRASPARSDNWQLLLLSKFLQLGHYFDIEGRNTYLTAELRAGFVAFLTV